MIILLAADYDDAVRARAAMPDVPVLVLTSYEHAKGIDVQPGARIHRTERWQYDERTVSALQVLHRRVGLVDPTGLLGPVQPSPGARTREPFGTPPVGSAVTPTVKKQRSNFDPNFGSVL